MERQKVYTWVEDRDQPRTISSWGVTEQIIEGEYGVKVTLVSQENQEDTGATITFQWYKKLEGGLEGNDCKCHQYALMERPETFSSSL